MKTRSIVLALVATLALAPWIPSASTAVAQTQDSQPRRKIEVIVRGGYTPARIEVRAGERIRLRFVRHEYASCTREVVFPTLGLRRELPPHEPVLIDLPALAPGEHEFHCGMNMIHGVIVVTAT